jgi:retinoid hydroxylase
MSDFPLPPGQLGLPFLGESIAFIKDPDFMAERQQRYGNIFKSSIFGEKTIFIMGAEALQAFFALESQNFVVNFPKPLRALIGENSLSLKSGKSHSHYRKSLAKFFQGEILATYSPKIIATTISYLKRWEVLQSFEWHSELRNYALDIACGLILGTGESLPKDFGLLYQTWSKGLFSINPKVFNEAMKAKKLLLLEIEILIDQQKENPQMQPNVLSWMLSGTDEHNNSIPLEEIKTQLLTLLFAGHETVASALCSLCLLLGQYPEVRERVAQEQIEGYSISPDSLKQLPYLDAVLKEVLRLIPPVGGGFRKAKQTCEIEGYCCPKGWNVIFQIDRTHLDPLRYPNPHQFNPDRFLNPMPTQPFTHAPYGGGIHECIGKEIAQVELKIFTTLLVQNYIWEIVPDQNLETERLPTPHPKGGLKVDFRPKSQSL